MTLALLNFASGIGLWLAITCGLCFFYLPYENKITGNLLVTSLLFFNNLNIFIAICEICLGLHITYIQDHHRKLSERYKGREWDGCVALLTMPLTPSQLFDSKIWAMMWSTYALYDPSYANPESFGFFIDVGNGYSTIAPCILLNVAMMFPEVVSPLLVGCVAIGSYWQVLYGTLIYFLSFMFNRRYAPFRPLEIGLFVGLTNGIWIIFPSIGLYAAVCILRDNDMSVFGV